MESIKIKDYTLFENTIIDFPILKNENQHSFNSLIEFELYLIINSDYLNSIYYNIDFMPNLNKFYLSGYSKDEVNEIDYKKFINKILFLKKIKRIKIYIPKKKSCEIKYSIDELNKIFQNIKFEKFYEIEIYKLNVINNYIDF